jgi:hypothetical protein
MKVEYLDVVSWEPASISFCFSSFPKDDGIKFKKWVEQWLRNFDRAGICTCKYSYADFKADVTHARVQLRTEWVCPKCIHVLAQKASEHTPALQHVVVGERFQIAERGAEVVVVPSKEVQLESGELETVDSFRIGRYPITCGQFEQFTSETGYLTTAERKGDTESFRANGTISGLPRNVQLQAAVACVSWEDALAYTVHARVRLPTEAEWLAASILDPTEVALSAEEEIQFRQKPLRPEMIISNCWELTASNVNSGLYIARRGPLYFKKRNWRASKEVAFNRRLVAKDEYDLLITFRVVH